MKQIEKHNITQGFPRGYSHRVEAINMKDKLVLVSMGGQQGLARIERFCNAANETISDTQAFLGYDARCEYKIGEELFEVPIDQGNVGEVLPARIIGPNGERPW